MIFRLNRSQEIQKQLVDEEVFPLQFEAVPGPAHIPTRASRPASRDVFV